MNGFQVNGDPVRFEDAIEGVRNLLADAFLDREAPGEKAYKPGQLRDSDDVLVGDVSNVAWP